MKTHEDGRYVVIKTLKSTVFETFFCIIIYCASTLSPGFYISTGEVGVGRTQSLVLRG